MIQLVFQRSHGTEMNAVTESSDMEMTYGLPAGNIIKVDSERFRCPEVHLMPDFNGKEARGMHNSNSIAEEPTRRIDSNCTLLA